MFQFPAFIVSFANLGIRRMLSNVFRHFGFANINEKGFLFVLRPRDGRKNF